MNPERIIVHRERRLALDPLLTDSALADCTTVTDNGDHLEVRPRFVPLSSGEALLWQLLDDLTIGTLNDAAWRLDQRNRRAVAEAVRLTMGVDAAVSR